MMRFMFLTLSIAFGFSALPVGSFPQLLKGAVLAHAHAVPIFIVSDVKVDTAAGNAVEAQRRAFADAQVKAAVTMVERLTVSSDREALGPMTENVARTMVAAVEVQEEKRSGTRYIGTLRIVFDPSRVRSYLRSKNVPFTESQARPAVLVARVGSGASPFGWRDAWKGESFREGLAPISLADSDDLDVAAREAANGSRRLILAEAEQDGSGFIARLYEISPNGSRVGLGGPIRSGDLRGLAVSSHAAITDSWKQSVIVRATGTTNLALTARYDSLSDWIAIRRGLSTSTLVTDMRVDAVATDGAMLTLSFAGTRAQLTQDLVQRGVRLTDGRDGPELRRTGR
jgi:hypothetical protein